jgi:hypothetical protein
MSDLGYAEIYIGGRLPASLVEDFINAVNGDIGKWGKDVPAKGFLEWLKENKNEEDGNEFIGADGSLRIAGGTIQNAEFVNLEGFCCEHNLTFIRYSEYCGGTNPCVCWKTPEMTSYEEHEKDINNNPCIPTHYLREAIKCVEEFKPDDSPLHLNKDGGSLNNQEFLAKWALQNGWDQMEALKALTDYICPEPPASPGAFEIISNT